MREHHGTLALCSKERVFALRFTARIFAFMLKRLGYTGITCGDNDAPAASYPYIVRWKEHL